MRIVEHTPDRLLLRHDPWLVSFICLSVGGSALWQLLFELPHEDAAGRAMLTGMMMMTLVVAMSGTVLWFFGRWIELRFERHTGQVTIARRLLPFTDLAIQRQTLPLHAINQVELQTYFNDIRMWRAALVTDPVKLPPEPRQALERREQLRKMHILLSQEGTFPMVPYFTSSEQEWVKVRDAVANWPGLPATSGRPSTI